MNELQIFNSDQFGAIRMIEEDGKVLFCGTDVASALGYSNSRDALSKHCRGVAKRDTPTNSGIQSMSFIPEGDVYRLITHSRLPAAERFEKWVFDGILPTIRKNGMYVNDELISTIAAKVVAEAMKQLAPLIKSHNEETAQSRTAKRISQYRQLSIIEQLSPELKTHIDGMIVSNMYSCQSIANFLIAHGVQISQMSVNKYAHKYFWDKEY